MRMTNKAPQSLFQKYLMMLLFRCNIKMVIDIFHRNRPALLWLLDSLVLTSSTTRSRCRKPLVRVVKQRRSKNIQTNTRHGALTKPIYVYICVSYYIGSKYRG